MFNTLSEENRNLVTRFGTHQMNIDNLTTNYSVIDDKPLIPCLLTFQRQYFSLYPPYLLTFPDSFLLASPGGQDFLLRHILGESVEADKLNVDQPTQRERWVKLYQPEKTYQIKVWKKIMICLEAGIKSAERLDNSEWVRIRNPIERVRLKQMLSALNR